MFGGRRGLVAVLAAGSVVLGAAQASGIEVLGSDPGATQPHAAADPAFPPSQGTTVRASVAADGSQAAHGGQDALISGDGRWEVFDSIDVLDPGSTAASAGQKAIFVRDLRNGTTRQISQATDDFTGGPVTEKGLVPDGNSSVPSISDNGRYVSFLTSANDIAPVAGSPKSTLVVCDRDPSGAVDANHDFVLDTTPPVCTAVDDTETSDTADLVGVPRLSGDGSTIAYTRTTGGSDSHSMVYFATTSSTSPITFNAPTSVDPGNTLRDAQDPVVDGVGFYVIYVATPNSGSPRILKTSVFNNVAKRVDVDPDGGFLGDNGNDTASGFVTFGSLSVSGQFADSIAFVRNWQDTTVKFAGPRAAVPAGAPSQRAYVVSDLGSGSPKSQIVSWNNDGSAVVPASSVALSGDGRYVAFATNGANSSDGTDVPGTTQVVVRDLELDRTRATRIAGALATPGQFCKPLPTPPATNCGSGTTSVSGLSLDGTGARVSYVDAAADLVTGDSNAAADAFVHTWQPTLITGSQDFGTVQTGANKAIDIPLQISGFGPANIDGVTTAGTDAADFAVTGDACSGTPVHADDSCTVTVRFSPTSVGAKAAALRVSASQLGAPTDVDALSGAGTLAGPKNAPATTIRTSVDPSGGEAQFGGEQSMISGNGRWDVFTSYSDLTGRQPSGSLQQNVFVRDLGDPQTTVQISLHETVGATPTAPSRPANPGGQPKGVDPNGQSFSPSISSDGRFVSFLTTATDIVPPRYGGGNNQSLTYTTAVVCDRDPNGDGRFDEVQPGTQLPDYTCFPVESGASSDDGLDLDSNSRPMLAGDGSRIAWVETSNSAPSSRRVVYADLPRSAGGALEAPGAFHYVASDIPDFSHAADRADETAVEQTQPVLNEDGKKIVYEAVSHPDKCCSAFAVIEADLAAGTDQRVDGLGNDNAAPDLQIDDQPAMSDDGLRVAYDYFDGTKSQVYVSTITGGTVTTQIESRNNDGNVARGVQPALSGDGRYLAFVTQAADMSNGVDPDGGACSDQTETDLHVVCQIVARDLVRDAQRNAAGLDRLPSELVSTALPGTKCPNAPAAGRLCGGDWNGFDPSLDNTGSEVGFDSGANDLVANDTNDTDGEGHSYTTDAFVHTWRPTLTSAPVDFGSVKLGTSKTKSASEAVQVLGTTPESFGPISLGAGTITGASPADFTITTDGCAGTTLHEGAPAGEPFGNPPETCVIKIRFEPTAQGPRAAALQVPIGKNSYPRVIRASKPPNVIEQQFDPAVVRTLTGFGAKASLVVNPTSLDFGKRRAKDPLTKTVTVTNGGSSPLVISGVVVTDTTVPGARNDYTVNFGNCLPQVAPGASCIISVTFSGSRVGVRNAVLVITSNASGGPTSVGLLARVLKPKIDSNPAVSVVRRVITVTGTNFAPNHVVEVGFDDDVQDTVKTDAHGAFTLTMIVLPNGRMGPRTLFGHSVGLSKTIRGEFDFLVVLGTSDPGNGQITRDN